MMLIIAIETIRYNDVLHSAARFRNPSLLYFRTVVSQTIFHFTNYQTSLCQPFYSDSKYLAHTVPFPIPPLCPTFS